MTTTKYLQIRFVYPLIWYALIMYASLTPSDRLPTFKFFPHFDKVVHFGIYSGLVILLIAAFLSKGRYNRSYAFAGIVSLLSGIIFEIAQLFLTTTRAGTFSDVVANSLGVLFGILFYHLVIRNKWIERKIFKIENNAQ